MKKVKVSDCIIPDEIIASVVINAAQKCDGIYCFEKKPFKLKYFFHNGENLKYVEIFECDEFYEITLYLNVRNGFSIPKTVKFVKENVKNAVERITDKKVNEVSVNIVSVHFDD